MGLQNLFEQKWHQNMYLYGLYLSYILYALILLGLSTNAPQYVKTLDSVLKIYISLFLVLKFNPFVKAKFNEFDRKLAFAAGIFLLTTTAITGFVLRYLKDFTPSKIKKAVLLP